MYEVSKVAEFVIVFPGGRGPPWCNLNFWILRKNQGAMELFISIFENSSPKGSFRSNKINYEILQLSADSRYLQSGPLNKALGQKVITLRTLLHLESFITFRPPTTRTFRVGVNFGNVDFASACNSGGI